MHEWRAARARARARAAAAALPVTDVATWTTAKGQTSCIFLAFDALRSDQVVARQALRTASQRISKTSCLSRQMNTWWFLLSFLLAGASGYAEQDSTRSPLACQPNAVQPMLPIFHIIGNVTKSTSGDGNITLEPINDCSGITFHHGVYHLWHQCCQNHWDHVISRDLIHWQRLPPPIQPLTTKTWDGSISMLPVEDGGPVILYDAQDGKELGSGLGDSPILGVARLLDPNDKYMLKWAREPNNPVVFIPKRNSTYFPSTVWKNGDHWNFIAQGKRFQSNDSSFHYWRSQGDFTGGLREHGGQWWLPVPNQIGGAPPPTQPTHIVNIAGGERYLFGTYHRENETFAHYRPGGEIPGLEAHLEGGTARWFAAQFANDRMLMIGWAQPDYGGLPNPHNPHLPVPPPAGPGIGLLTRLTLLRQVNYDLQTKNLVSNPVPELKGLRTGVLARVQEIALMPSVPYIVKGTENGSASSADVELSFSGFAANKSRAVFGACVLSSGRQLGGLGITITIEAVPSIDGQSATNSTIRVGHVSTGTCDAASGIAAPYASPRPNKPRFVQARAGGQDQPFIAPGPIQLFDETELTVRITPDRSLADFFVRTKSCNGCETDFV
eukprot:COSAG02_NODE_2698_length_8208_cov_10.377482_1_plen_611_part_00